MSLKKDTVINYFSRGYLGLVGILISPLLVHILGKESFGLIGIFTLIQTWLQVIDMGLSNTLTRESAKYQTGIYSSNDFNKLIKYIQSFYFVIFFAMLILFFVGAEYIAGNLINSELLPEPEVILYVKIMAFSFCFNFLSVPYRSVLVGMSEHKTVAKIDVLMATFRSPFCALILFLFSGGLLTYILIQVAHALIIFFLLFFNAKVQIKKERDKKNEKENIAKEVLDIVSTLKFSMQILMTTLVWLVVSQFDKLYLSTVLPLSEYGMLSLAVQLSSGIMLLSAPFSIALTPKLVSLKIRNKMNEFNIMYLTSFHFIMSLLVPICFIISFFSQDILLLWTASESISVYGEYILSLYILGNLLLVVTAYAYYIQYSFGDLRLHVYMSIVSAVLIIPAYILMINKFNTIGSAMTWLIYNATLCLFWVPYIQYKYLSMKVVRMFAGSFITVILINLMSVSIVKYVGFSLEGYLNLILFSFIFCFNASISLLMNSEIRGYLIKLVRLNHKVANH